MAEPYYGIPTAANTNQLTSYWGGSINVPTTIQQWYPNMFLAHCRPIHTSDQWNCKPFVTFKVN